jgi:ribosomal protein L24
MKKDRIDYKPKIKKGDTVMVISGNYKGKTGRVLEVIYKEERAIVEGINIISKHTKPNQKILKVALSKGSPDTFIKTHGGRSENQSTNTGWQKVERKKYFGQVFKKSGR